MKMMEREQLKAASLNACLSLEEMAQFCRGLAGLAPDLVRNGTLGQSREGRTIPLLVITDFASGGAEEKPAVYLHAQVHSHEFSSLCGALNLAYELVTDDAHADLLKRVAFYIVPRINPDGAHEILTQRASCNRSRFDDSDRTRPNTWVQCDVDGNGLVLEMRRPDPDGPFCPSPDDPRVLVPRSKNSQGPFYTVNIEGRFLNFDGSSAWRNGESSIDFNRNYAGSWSPGCPGAGEYPFSEPETRAVADFFARHPNIFAAFDLHNGPLQLLAPPAVRHLKIEQEDEPLFQQVFDLARACRINASAVFAYPDPGRPHDCCGNFVDWAYFDRGLLGWGVELGTVIYSVLDEDAAQKNDASRAAHPALMAWQERHTEEPRRLHEWKKFSHPQLGEVELGGADVRALGIPGKAELEEFCRRFGRFVLQQSAMAPHLEISALSAAPLGKNQWRIAGTLANTGALSTAVTARGELIRFREAPYLELRPDTVCRTSAGSLGMEMPHLGPGETKPFEWKIECARPSGSILCRGGAGGSFIVSVPEP